LIDRLERRPRHCHRLLPPDNTTYLEGRPVHLAFTVNSWREERRLKKPKFLWDLSKLEVLRGVKAFLKETGVQSGSIIGYYNLYKAVLKEWEKSRQIKKKI